MVWVNRVKIEAINDSSLAYATDEHMAMDRMGYWDRGYFNLLPKRFGSAGKCCLFSPFEVKFTSAGPFCGPLAG